MSLNLPTPIDLALLNERIEAWLNALVASYEARQTTAFCRYCQDTLHVEDGVWVDRTSGDCCSGDDNLVNENEPHVPAPRYGLSIETAGRKYWRVVMDDGNGQHRSVHAFVDSTTGDVLKAAGWKAPAKGVRYNLLNDASYEQLLAAVDPFGSYLYIR